jgi:nucleoside-diphosphate-sugar epimerase
VSVRRGRPWRGVVRTVWIQRTGEAAYVQRHLPTWGPLMDPQSPFNHIPPYISAVLRGDEPQPLYADDGGDSCYAPDTGRAIALLMSAETLRHDTYNVSSGRPFVNRELADAVQAITPACGSTCGPDGRLAPARTLISTPPGSSATLASRRPSTSPRRSPTTSRGGADNPR